MKVPGNLRVGVATQTGRVRRTNEDDYLLVAPDPEHLLVVLADGMGGATGGAEASRIAVRSLASAFLAGSGTPAERMRVGHGAACRAVYERSREAPALRDMGTTLTAVWLEPESAVIGHVGDTRALCRRNGRVIQWTDDHAVRGAESYLTRCIGGGQAEENPDVFGDALRPGDRLVLLTDGVWGVVTPEQLERCLARDDPQAVADGLVAAAVRAGGPDNATALVVDRQPGSTPAGSGPWQAQHLAAGELPVREVPTRMPPSLARARWPYFAWFLAVVVLGLVAARNFAGWDPLRDLVQVAKAWFAEG